MVIKKPLGALSFWWSVCLVLLLTGCTSHLLTREDYQLSLYHHSAGSPGKSLKRFPKGEHGTFITTLEKSYLKLLSGQPDNAALHKLVDSIEQRIRYQGSREVMSLFYAETAEGYYASEHEIIWLHLLLSWGYSLQQEYEKACIEARKASHLLSAPWSHEGHFDDALLRMFLGGLWTMCGSWEDAQVDFRKAYQLSPETTWLKQLLELEEPPKNLYIVLGGIGPRAYWDPDANINVVRGIRNVSFHAQGQKSKLVLIDQLGNEIPMHISPDSSFWYQRHIERDNAIHELLVDSHYTATVAGSMAVESAKIAAGIAVGTGIIIGSVIIGGVIVYVAIHVESAEIAIIGVSVALGGAKTGLNVIGETAEDSVETIKEDLDTAKNYRFVRFLPEYLWMGWTNEESKASKATLNGRPQNLINPATVLNRTYTHLSYLPDIDPFKNRFLKTFEAWNDWKRKAREYLADPYQVASWEKLINSSKQLLGLVELGEFGLTINLRKERYNIKIDSSGISGYIVRGLFKEGPKYRLDFLQRSLTVDNAARGVLIRIKPSDMFSAIYRQINEQIFYLKNK